MNAAIEVLVAIVRNPTAQAAAGATIANPPDVCIPPRIVSSRPDDGRLWKWRRRGNQKPISTAAWKSRTEREIPTFPQAACCCVLIEKEMEGTKSYPRN
jgi:hypothetical protein